jgi:hypothetical protein
MISSRRMRCSGKVACVGRREIHAGFWWGYLKDTDHLKDLEGDRRITLKKISRKGEKRNACRVLVGVPEGYRPLGRPGSR